ncbi:MAG TPA: PP2C family serine/threonine-protein phosphatase [Methylocella sp.]|nr:PP2C family serine/threonine-protein phosphatase [Methylocella sp.]
MAFASPEADLTIEGAMLTHVGRVRQSNEDCVAFVIPPPADPAAARGFLCIVADGMGGHAAGEVASRMAVEVVRRVYYSLQGPVPNSLEAAFASANRAIFEESQSTPECRGMGTTCTALAIRKNDLWFAHVGDTRAYLLRDGRLSQLTEDQTLHAEMIRQGLMAEEDAKNAEGGNVILQALGTGLDLSPALPESGIPIVESDLLILCSDGLWNLVNDGEISGIAGHFAPPEACQKLLERALEAGGYDNISVGVFAIRAAGGVAKEPTAATRPIESAYSATTKKRWRLARGA